MALSRPADRFHAATTFDTGKMSQNLREYSAIHFSNGSKHGMINASLTDSEDDAFEKVDIRQPNR
jgi:hypothetical protein